MCATRSNTKNDFIRSHFPFPRLCLLSVHLDKIFSNGIFLSNRRDLDQKTCKDGLVMLCCHSKTAMRLVADSILSRKLITAFYLMTFPF